MRYVLDFAMSFAGSFLCFVLWIHFHLDDLWAERRENIEARRARKRYARGLKHENDDRVKKGYRPLSDPPTLLEQSRSLEKMPRGYG